VRVLEYACLQAGEIAQLVAAGEVSAGDVLNCAVAAIESANPQLNAVVALDAEAAAAQIARGLPRGPLHGVPVLLKDLGCPATGTRSTFGSELFADAPVWTHDCAFVDRLRKAGAVILGRTNSCEFGISLITEPHWHGPTHNPHQRGLSPGGSSGGSAAAVACGMVPVAHATDGCGSIRVPASHCGLVGLKPSRGRISFSPDVGESWGSMSVHGALARTVGDAALMLDVTAIPYPGDPYCLAPPSRPFRELAAEAPRSLRIGLPLLTSNQGIDRECLAALQTAANACQDLGHHIVPASFECDLVAAFEHFTAIWSAQLWSQLQARYQQLARAPDGNGIEPLSWALACKGRDAGPTDYLTAVRFIHAFGRRFAETFSDCDVVMTPVTSRTVWPLGELKTDGDDVAAYLADLFRLCPFTVAFNMAGCPAISVPLHWSEQDLPVGVQLGARMGEDLLLLQLATQLEQALPWRARTRKCIEAWQTRS
jgi:Asp-tRNA(Asn)/Glu-tRNA(Gln) amidotransferase A subunit family amidase